ncbi:MAG: arginine--tRNA ligase [Bacilli bacterium]
MINYKKYIQEKLFNILNVENISVENPPKENMGDFSVPCFNLRNEELKTPFEVSSYIKDNFVDDKGYFKEITVMGCYINFFLNYNSFDTLVINEIINNSSYGSFNQGNNEKLLLEHTSINPNASPHIGRIRNSLIGDFLGNLFSFVGYVVERHYFINDIGKQISYLLLAYEKYGNSKTTFKDMLELYIKINAESKVDSSIEEKAFYYLNELEHGNKEVREKFKHLTDICVEGQTSILNSIDIHFDIFTHESDFVFDDSTKNILDMLNKKNVLKEDDEGRKYADLSGYDIPTKSPVLVLTRKDNTSLYPLRDIAYTLYKLKRNSNNNYIVLGEDQETYMKQIAAVIDILELKAPVLISYSFVLLNGDKMATRDGKIVLLEDFLEIVKTKLKEEFNTRNILVNEENLSILANACIKYTMYNVSINKCVNFNYKDAISFTGESGIYILYSIVRINSILKSNKYDEGVSLKYINNIEHKIIKELYMFPYIIDSLLTTHEASNLTSYLYKLATLFSSYYENVPISSETDEVLKASRICLLISIKKVLTSALAVLGIKTVDKM